MSIFLPFVANTDAPDGARPPLAPIGFPSPAADHSQKRIDLNAHLVPNVQASFFVRVTGDAMVNAGIFDGDTLIVDRSVIPRHGHVVLAVVDNEFLVRRFCRKPDAIRLLAENPVFPPCVFSEESELVIWGVVRWNLRRLLNG